jgi:predicted nucleic acid-binding protein
MGWIEDLHGKTVGLDTSPFIYYIEGKPGYVEVLRLFFQMVDKGQISVVTSIVTLLETLVHPFRNGNTELARQYREILFHTGGLTTIQFSQDIAEEAARLRAYYPSIRTPDAIQMATAINANASFFLTNDVRLPSLPNLKMLQLDELITRL